MSFRIGQMVYFKFKNTVGVIVPKEENFESDLNLVRVIIVAQPATNHAAMGCFVYTNVLNLSPFNPVDGANLLPKIFGI